MLAELYGKSGVLASQQLVGIDCMRIGCRNVSSHIPNMPSLHTLLMYSYFSRGMVRGDFQSGPLVSLPLV